MFIAYNRVSTLQRDAWEIIGTHNTLSPLIGTQWKVFWNMILINLEVFIFFAKSKKKIISKNELYSLFLNNGWRFRFVKKSKKCIGKVSILIFSKSSDSNTSIFDFGSKPWVIYPNNYSYLLQFHAIFSYFCETILHNNIIVYESRTGALYTYFIRAISLSRQFKIVDRNISYYIVL